MRQTKLISTLVATCLASFGFVVAAPPASANSPFSVAQHNIAYNYPGAMRYVAEHDRPLAFSVNEVCPTELIQLASQVGAYGYSGRAIQVHPGAPGCGGNVMFNAAFTLAARSCGSEPCGKAVHYPSQIRDPAWPHEHRGSACVRGAFGYLWVVCSTHMSVHQGYALLQTVHFKDNILGVEDNMQVKLAGGDFNLRPRPYDPGTYGVNQSNFYQSYREADQHYYNTGVNNSTRNPPGTYLNQKIDYVFAGRFWTLDAFGVQDRRCNTGSDHCLIIGTFRWA